MGDADAAVPVVLRRLVARRLVGEISPLTRMVLNEGPLTGIVLLILVLAQSFHPALLDDRLFHLAVALHLLAFTVCVVVPWERLPPQTALAVPLFDFLPIGILREATQDVLVTPGALAVIPVIWLTGSGLAPNFTLAVSFLGPLLMVLTPAVVSGTASARELTEMLILPFMTFATGLAIMVLSAAKAKEDRMMSAVLETVGVGVVVLDADGHVVRTNEQQRRNAAVAAPLGSPDGSAGLPVVFGGDRKPLPSGLHPVERAARGETFSDHLVWVGEPDRQRVYSTSARAIRDGVRGEGAVVAFSDVTALVSALDAKDSFLSGVSHELRTPLTSILGYLEMLQDERELPPEIASDLDVIERNAKRLERLVADLLSAASGSVDVHPEPADLAEVIRLSVASAAPRAAVAGVLLRNSTEDPLPAMIDPVRIGQVLDNLLSNAIKYSPDGGTVTVQGRHSGDHVLFEVRDTGLGMDEDEQAQLFTPFYRAATVRNRSIPGVGLGLSISKLIVDNHGGSICFRSVRDAGTTVTVTLPAAGEAPAG